MSCSQTSRGSFTGRMPFLKQLLWKMSAKSGAMTQRMPKSSSAQGACSRDEPQPKFSMRDQDFGLPVRLLVQHEIGPFSVRRAS